MQPRFTWSSSESVTVVQGDNLTLECVAHGVPAPQLSWEKYGGHVPYGRHSLLLGKISILCILGPWQSRNRLSGEWAEWKKLG